MDWSWWSAELATAVTGPRYPRVPYMVCEGEVNRREKLHYRIFDATSRMNDPEILRKIQ
jgi:hypothetical protein